MYSPHHPPRRPWRAAISLAAALLSGGVASAQQAATPDDRAPVVVIPTSDGSVARTLVLQRPSRTSLPISPAPTDDSFQGAPASGGLRLTLSPGTRPALSFQGLFFSPPPPSGWLWTLSTYAMGTPARLAGFGAPMLRPFPGLRVASNAFPAWRPFAYTSAVFQPIPVALRAWGGLSRLPNSLHDYHTLSRRPHDRLIRSWP